MTIQETWKDIPGHEGSYQVSDLGRVWSRKTGACLALSRRKDGYLQANLRQNGQQISRLVQHLVLEIFVGPRPSRVHHACHNDGQKANNRLENLRWDTPEANCADKRLHGTHREGENAGLVKLTEAAVRQIRARRGEPQADLAAEFGCTFSNVSAIQLRKSWRHV